MRFLIKMKFLEDYRRNKNSKGYVNILWWMLDQSFWVILSYRVFNAINKTRFGLLSKFAEKVLEAVFKCYVPSGVEIGGGLIIYHAHGIILNGKSVIGNNCTIYSRVCIGNRWPGDGTPTIGDNVVIGTGACIFGPVKIPSNSMISANSVITPSNVSEIFGFEDFEE